MTTAIVEPIASNVPQLRRKERRASARRLQVKFTNSLYDAIISDVYVLNMSSRCLLVWK